MRLQFSIASNKFIKRNETGDMKYDSCDMIYLRVL